MFALFSLSPLEILILGFVCLAPVSGLLVVWFIIRSTRNTSNSSESQFQHRHGPGGVSAEDEIDDLRRLVRMQEEKIDSLKAEVKELTDKLQSRGSTDITT